MLESNNNNTFLLNIAINNVEKATYAGIDNDGKTHGILDTNGNITPKNGRKVQRVASKLGSMLHITDNKTFGDKQQKSEENKFLSERRAEVIRALPEPGNSVQDTKNGVSKLLTMLDTDQLSLTETEKAAIQPVIDTDLKTYLTTEIKKCSSGEKLVELKKHIDALEKNQSTHKIAADVLASLKRKTYSRMKEYVQAMPKHLEQIYKTELDKNIHQDSMVDCKKKYLAIHAMYTYINSLTQDNSEEQFLEQKQALKNLMITTFNSDVTRLTNQCLKGSDLQKSNELYTLITDIKGETIVPFFNATSDQPMTYIHQIDDAFNKKITALETQIQTAPRLIEKMQNCVDNAARIITKEQNLYKTEIKYFNHNEALKKARKAASFYQLYTKATTSIHIQKNHIKEARIKKKTKKIFVS